MNTKKIPFPVYSFGVTKVILDELRRANYDNLKKHIEVARFRFLQLIGFEDSVSLPEINVGLRIIKETYEYIKDLKYEERLMIIPHISVTSRNRLYLKLNVVHTSDSGVDVTSEARYTMIVVDLKKDAPIRIPKQIIDSIRDFAKAYPGFATPPSP